MSDNCEKRYLVEKYLEGTLKEDEADQLASLLVSDDEVQRLMHENVLIHFLLRQRCCESDDPRLLLNLDTSTIRSDSFLKPLTNQDWDELLFYEKIAIPVVRESAKETSNRWYGFFYTYQIPILLVSLVFFVSSIVWISLKTLENGSSTNSVNSISSESHIARIAEIIDPVWDEEGKRYGRGQLLNQDRLFLKSGIVKLELPKDVELIMEGPTDLTIKEPSKVFCNHGNLSINVGKQGRGFAVDTQFGSFIDRGTEFALTIDSTSSELNVIRGEVDVNSGQKILKSTTGKAIKVQLNRKPVFLTANLSKYMDSLLFQSKLLVFGKKLESRRLDQYAKWDQSPDLLARFDMDLAHDSVVPNASIKERQKITEAGFVDCRLTEGPNPGMKALLINRVSSKIQIHVPDYFQTITLVANIQLNKVRKGGNVLFAAESFQNKQGTILWQLLPDGVMLLQVRGNNGRTKYYKSPPLDSQNFCGTWTSLAVSLDTQSRSIKMYANGNLVHSEKWKNPVALHLGNAVIGNVPVNTLHEIDQSLGGCISGFMIFDSALDADRIREYMTIL